MAALQQKNQPLPMSNTQQQTDETSTPGTEITPNQVVRQNQLDPLLTNRYVPKKRKKTNTVMTGPSGVLGSAPIQKKTLLGS